MQILAKTKKIEGYNVGEFVQKALAASKEGYTLDFDTNEHAPRNFGSYYACVMVLSEDTQQTSDVLPELKSTRRKTKE